MQHQRRSGFGHECRNAGSSRLGNENQAAAKEKARREKCEAKTSLIRKYRVIGGMGPFGEALDPMFLSK